MTIDRDSFVPLYVQVKTALERRILSGEFKEGEAIESEPALCRRYGVSRITIRQALRDLDLEGVIRREPGRGTFVETVSAGKGISIGLVYDLNERMFEHRDESMFGDLVRGAANVASRRGAVVHPLPLADGEDLGAVLATPLLSSLKGLLLVPDLEPSEKTLVDLDRTGMPYVVLKRRMNGRSACVDGDDRGGSEAATSHLIALGHERIAAILMPEALGHGDRLAGYTAALTAAGRDVAPELIRRAGYPVSTGGAEAMRELLSLPDRPTAVFAASDHLAVGAYEALREVGMEPGRDIAVIGYGGASFAALMYPALSTISNPWGEIGSVGAGLLLDMVTGNAQGRPARTARWSLDIRQSTEWKEVPTVGTRFESGDHDGSAEEGVE